MNRNTDWRRLAQGQRSFLAVAAMAWSVFLTGFSLNPFSASTPALMILAHAETGKQVETKIEAKSGAGVAPGQGKPQEQWVIRSGDAIKSDTQPTDRAVKFYRGTSGEGMLLFIIKVRYFRNVQGAWVPQYQLDEEPLVTQVNGRWQPLTTVQGVPSLIVITSNTLPNADGFYSSLDFRFSAGPMSIDAWSVQ
ncbi:MAG TPA: hypothetical protein VEI74_00970 [Candidatus Methylomirabilis sp.]|nr:hypothetical protein [Candidatus Methylomirabilis sp.]